MVEDVGPQSRNPRTRSIGVVYLLYFVTAILGGVLTPGTATAILAHQSMFRLGFAVSAVSVALYITVVALFYSLFKPVNRHVALLAAFLGLVGCFIQAFASVFQVAPIVLLGDRTYSGAFSHAQLTGLAQVFLELDAQANFIAVVFFGLFDIAIGYLVFRSTFLPRALGVLMAIAGVGWLAFLSPPFANSIQVFIEVPGFLAELALMLWLLARGVDRRRWTDNVQTVSPTEPLPAPSP
jgi:hypothetical protein